MERPLKLGIIGWYGHDNAGDERILYCLKEHFAGAEFLVLGLDDMQPRMAELDSCDFVLFGGGGLILRGFGTYAPAFARLRARLGCVGISVEALHADNVGLVRTIEQKAEFILVRDEGSWEAFGRSPKVIIGPDLTFLRPLDVATPPAEETCGVNLRSWPYWTWEHLGAMDRFMHRIDRRAPWLRRRYPFAAWDPREVMDVLRSQLYSLTPLPLYTKACPACDTEVLRQQFGECPSHMCTTEIGMQRYLCGMRLHSLIFACQTGTPFVSLSYQPKNREFCRSVGMQEFSVDLGDSGALFRAISAVRGSYDAVRERLLTARARNTGAISAIMADIAVAIGTIRSDAYDRLPEPAHTRWSPLPYRPRQERLAPELVESRVDHR